MFNNDFKNKLYDHFSKLDNDQNAFMNALVVSKKHKTLFFHIAKTGGSSITHELINNGFDDNILDNRKIDRNHKLKYLKDIEDDWDNYYKFTFVRNKFTQLKSLYNMNKNRSHTIPQNVTFNNFINTYINKSSAEYCLWLDQYNLTHIDNKCIFDFIGKFSNYKNDRYTFFNKFNINDRNLHHNKGHYNKEENLSYNNNMIETLKNTFKEEFHHFKWEKL